MVAQGYEKLSGFMRQQARLESAQRAEKRAEKWAHTLRTADNRFAFFRFSSTLVLLALFFSYSSGGRSTLLIFYAVMFFLLYSLLVSLVHQRIQKKQKMWEALRLSYQSTVVRMERRFSDLEGLVPSWSKEINRAPPHHPYASDLDVNASLFLFLNSCTTKEGGVELLRLLLNAGLVPENSEMVFKRSQLAVTLGKQKKLLRKLECLKFNEVLFYSLRKGNNNTHEEGEKPTSSLGCAIYAIFCVGLWGLLLFPAFIHFIKTSSMQGVVEPLVVYTLFLMIGGFVYAPVTTQAERLAVNLRVLKEIISFLRVQSVESLPFSFLKRSSLFKIKEYCFYHDLLSLRGNPIFWIMLHLFFPFDAVLTLILQWKNKRMQELYPVFKNELAAFDVACAFARVQIENVGMHFLAEIPHSQSDHNRVEWVDLGHPLIPAQKRVSNSLTLERKSPAVLLTGSNMAGKSTFLRTLGVNVLLANMGAPVCASVFRAPHFKLLCAIRIDDSLSEGTSYFYAEVKRLKFILTALETPEKAEKSLFLIDEIFKGTNNKERFIGSKSILYALFQTGAFGLVSTHDLALSGIEKEDGRLRNMHFREHVEHGALAFDYLLREGPCPTTNALQIMKQEGLPLLEGIL